MSLAELPFYELLIRQILPITIAILLFIKIFKMLLNMYSNYTNKSKSSSFMILEIGDVLLFIVFFYIIIQILYYMTGNVPDDFSIFNYVIDEALSITWYTILIYGILTNFYIFTSRDKVRQ